MWTLAIAIALAGSYEDGVAALTEGRAADAEALLAKAAAEAPTSVEARWELGFAHYTQREFADAAAAWGEVQRLDPKHADLDFWLMAARYRAELAGKPIPAAAVDAAPSGSKRVTIASAGDTMMGSDLKRGAAGLAPDDGASLFAAVAPLFQAADLAFLNLEGPLADGLPSTKCGPQSTSCYAFRTPTRYVAALQSAGIDVAQLANNHAWDLGVPGQLSTMKTLDAAGIAHAGRFTDTAVVERNGLKIAYVAAHFGECCLNVNQPAEVQRAIGVADETADLVVFVFHGGAEGAGAQHVPGQTEIGFGEQRGDEKALARAAVDAGADLVVGTGPHVLRAMEVYKGRLIAYSLGNFMGYKQFGTGGGPTGTTVILEATLAENGALVAAKLHPLLLSGESVPGPDPALAGLDYIRSLSAADFPDTGVKVAPDGTLSWR